MTLEDDPKQIVNFALHPVGGLPDLDDAGDRLFVGNDRAQAETLRVVEAVHPVDNVKPPFLTLGPVDRGEIDEECEGSITLEELTHLDDTVGGHGEGDLTGKSIGGQHHTRHLGIQCLGVGIIGRLLVHRRHRFLLPRILGLSLLGRLLLGRRLRLRLGDLRRLLLVAQRLFFFGLRGGRLFRRCILGFRRLGRCDGFVVAHRQPHETRVRAMVSPSILRCSCIRP